MPPLAGGKRLCASLPATKAVLRFGEQRRMATALWSDQSILRSDETWLPEWSGNLGGVQRWHSSVAWGDLGQASLSAYGIKPVG
jgi:hypothetical protein